MQVIAHAFGITVRFPGQPPVASNACEVIQCAVSRYRNIWRNGYITPRHPDPNP